MMNNNYNLKYIIVGDICVGKSCLLLQYTDKRFEPMHDMTIGVEFGYKILYYDNNTEVKIQIWDTAGQESFRSIIRSYFRGAIGALVVFDITKRETFNSVKYWLNDVKNTCSSSINITLVGNKIDLENKRVISRQEALELANEYNINYIETSAKTGYNVDEAFNSNVNRVLHQIKNGQIDSNFFTYKQKQILIKEINKNKYEEENNKENKCYCF
jgi:Ras-related protein Rab-2A